MFALNKIVLATLAVSSSAVFAGAMGPVCTPGNVTIPCERSAWGFGAAALYLQPSYSFLAFSESNQIDLILPPGPDIGGGGVGGAFFSGGNTANNDISNHWNWGFKLDGSYYFNSGNDLSINWYHMNRSINQAISGGAVTETSPTTGFVTDFQDVITGSTFFSNVASYLNTQWDAVNVEFGQHMDFSLLKNVRFHGGVQYARIHTTFDNAATSPSNTPPINVANEFDVLSTNGEMIYNGFGPRIGTDLSYSWENGFSIYADGEAALLVGPRSFAGTIIGTSNGLFGGTVGLPYNAYARLSSTVIVPELEAKLGAGYTRAMWNGSLMIDAGWMWVNYFNAQVTNTIASSDFGVEGPYAGLKWVGNLA